MGRTPCCDKSGLKKGPWTPEEDQKLIDYIQKHGYGNWRTLPKNAGLQRCGKSCRLRWTNYLRPDIKRGRFSFEEEETIIQLHSVLGNKWSAIAARLPGRTDNEIKNYWNTHIRKRLLRMGIDPVTHNPRLDLLDLSSLFGSHLYNQTHTNLSRLLGVVDPQLLKLATSLISNQNQNQNSQSQTTTHHHHDHDHSDHLQLPHQVQTQIPQFQANIYNSNDNLMMMNASNCDIVVPTFSDQAHSLDQFGTSDQWMHNVENLDCVPLLPSYYGAAYDQTTTEPSTLSSEPSNLYSSTGFGFNVSTPSSSPTPLNSSSTTTTTYNNNGGGSCCTMSTDQDERESYCSGLLKFEVPDLLDVSELL